MSLFIVPPSPSYDPSALKLSLSELDVPGRLVSATAFEPPWLKKTIWVRGCFVQPNETVFGIRPFRDWLEGELSLGDFSMSFAFFEVQKLALSVVRQSPIALEWLGGEELVTHAPDYVAPFKVQCAGSVSVKMLQALSAQAASDRARGFADRAAWCEQISDNLSRGVLCLQPDVRRAHWPASDLPSGPQTYEQVNQAVIDIRRGGWRTETGFCKSATLG